LERIREADTQVRWQHEEDVEECQGCRSAFSFTRSKVCRWLLQIHSGLLTAYFEWTNHIDHYLVHIKYKQRISNIRRRELNRRNLIQQF
jgi:hypothetical protein